MGRSCIFDPYLVYTNSWGRRFPPNLPHNCIPIAFQGGLMLGYLPRRPCETLQQEDLGARPRLRLA